MGPPVSVLNWLTGTQKPKTSNRRQTLIRPRKFNCNENTGAANPEAACSLAARTPRKLVQRESRKPVGVWDRLSQFSFVRDWHIKCACQRRLGGRQQKALKVWNAEEQACAATMKLKGIRKRFKAGTQTAKGLGCGNSDWNIGGSGWQAFVYPSERGDAGGDFKHEPAQQPYPKKHVDEIEDSTTCSNHWTSSQQADRIEFKPENRSGCGTACLGSHLFAWHTKTQTPNRWQTLFRKRKLNCDGRAVAASPWTKERQRRSTKIFLQRSLTSQTSGSRRHAGSSLECRRHEAHEERGGEWQPWSPKRSRARGDVLGATELQNTKTRVHGPKDAGMMLNQQDRVDFKPWNRSGYKNSSPKPKPRTGSKPWFVNASSTATKTLGQQALRPHACWLLANLSNVRLEHKWGAGQPADSSNWKKGCICGGLWLSNCEGSCSRQKTGPGSHKAERDRDAMQSRNGDRKRIGLRQLRLKYQWQRLACLRVPKGLGGMWGGDCKPEPAQGF